MSRDSSPVLMEFHPFYEGVGSRIGAERIRQKPALSQQELADRIGLSRTSIANIEGGRQQLLLHHAVAIADVLGVELAVLVPPLVAAGDDPRVKIEAIIERVPMSDQDQDWVRRAVAPKRARGTKQGNRRKP